MGSRPTVGRIVHYRHVDNDAPFAALVLAVPTLRGENDENVITASIHTDVGGRFTKELIEGQRSKEQREWWEWPPRDPAA